MSNVYTPDLNRGDRIGLEEAIFCEGKSSKDLLTILSDYHENNTSCLLTRLSVSKFESLPKQIKEAMDFDPFSKTGFFGQVRQTKKDKLVAIVTAGTSDIGVAREAARTLQHAGENSIEYDDLGVAGLENSGEGKGVTSLSGCHRGSGNGWGTLWGRWRLGGKPGDRCSYIRWLWSGEPWAYGPFRGARELCPWLASD